MLYKLFAGVLNFTIHVINCSLNVFATIKGTVLSVTSEIGKIYNKINIWFFRYHLGTS